MKNLESRHLGQSIGMAVVLVLMSLAVIAMMSWQSHLF